MATSIHRIEITGGTHRYDALVGRGLLNRAPELLRPVVDERRVALICDTNTQRLAGRLAQRLGGAEVFAIPAGEESKSLEQVSVLCDQLIAAGCDRSACVIGVGGGVVGDLSGFVAAIFERGIPHVQVPTTLLAMADSSIGGKTGVNARAGKNLIGAIHQPSLVLADLDTLDSLPERELRQGFAEIIKHAVIRDAAMFDSLQPFDRGDLASLVARSIEIKAAIVAADERELTGERALLNFGHTVGHAIERAAGYGQLLHGEAISLGMVAACAISMKRAGLAPAQRDRVVAMLQQFGLPTSLPPGVSREAILDAVQFDKKFRGGAVRFVVTPRLGEACLSTDVTIDDIREAVGNL